MSINHQKKNFWWKNAVKNNILCNSKLINWRYKTFIISNFLLNFSLYQYLSNIIKTIKILIVLKYNKIKGELCKSGLIKYANYSNKNYYKIYNIKK